MKSKLKQKIIETCNKKIDAKGDNVGLSFYAFFENKNNDPLFINGNGTVVDFDT